MALSATVTMEWGDGTYPFTLRLREIEELQRLTGTGFGSLARRVLDGDFYIRDVHETIRLGLIGGGLDPVRAKELVTTYVEGRPIYVPGEPSSPLLVAQEVILAVYSGVPETTEADKEKPMAGMTDGSTSRPSARPRSKRASARAKSS